MPTSIPITAVDTFTDRPFTGNPAAVCVLAPDDGADDAWLAAVAGELGQPATAFVIPRFDEDHDLRWFTPSGELSLCGHATLAAAHVLGRSTTFHTLSGPLAVIWAPGAIEMALPSRPVTPTAHDAALGRALGTSEVYFVARHGTDLVVELGSAADVRELAPDLRALAAFGARAYAVTAPGDRPGIDVVSRVFIPGVDGGEDPVTGSAHCMLAPHWAARFGRSVLVGEQASKRGGLVGMRIDGDRVHLRGSAVTIWRGELQAPPHPLAD